MHPPSVPIQDSMVSSSEYSFWQTVYRYIVSSNLSQPTFSSTIIAKTLFKLYARQPLDVTDFETMVMIGNPVLNWLHQNSHVEIERPKIVEQKSKKKTRRKR